MRIIGNEAGGLAIEFEAGELQAANGLKLEIEFKRLTADPPAGSEKPTIKFSTGITARETVADALAHSQPQESRLKPGDKIEDKQQETESDPVADISEQIRIASETTEPPATIPLASAYHALHGDKPKLKIGDMVEIEGEDNVGTIKKMVGDMAIISWKIPPLTQISLRRLKLAVARPDPDSTPPDIIPRTAAPAIKVGRGRRTRRATAAAGKGRKVIRSPKKCVICGKEFRDTSRTYTRKTCGKKCGRELVLKKKSTWARKMRKGSTKAPPPGRAALIEESVRRLAGGDPRPSVNGRVLPLIDPAREDG